MHIRAAVQFVHRVQAWNRWRERWKSANVPHRKRRDADPRRAAVKIQIECIGNKVSHEIRIDAPVHEQQLSPVLMHDRLTRRPMPHSKSVSVSWVPAREWCLHRVLLVVEQVRCHVVQRSFQRIFVASRSFSIQRPTNAWSFQVHENTADMYAIVRPFRPSRFILRNSKPPPLSYVLGITLA